jgi:hypothetical protein
MTTKSHRGRIVSAGVAAVLTAGLATGALAAQEGAPQTTKGPQVAVLATVGTPAPAIERALAVARQEAGSPGAATTVLRVGGPLDAQAQAAALATGEYAVVAGVGDAGRAAVGQAASAQIGEDTRWVEVP